MGASSIARALAPFLAALALPAWSALVPLPGTTPQQGIAGTPLPNAIAFRVTADDGTPTPGAVVKYATYGGIYAEAGAGCSAGVFGEPVSYCSGTTGADGTVTFPRVRGTYEGTYTIPVTATLGGVAVGSATLTFTIAPRGTRADISIVSGDAQRTTQGTPFAAPLVLRVTRSGAPVPNAVLNVVGSIAGASDPYSFSSFQFPLMTDATGMASYTFRPDGAVGSGVIRIDFYDSDAGAISHAQGSFTVTNSRGGFDLALQDLWWGGPTENGWGMSVFQHGERLFNVLFVYDAQGNPTWYAMSNTRWLDGFGGKLAGDLYHPRGTPWYAYDASRLTLGAERATAGVYFDDERHASLYPIFIEPDYLSPRSKAIVPQDFARGGVSPITGVGDLWWGGVQQNGWGVAIHEQAGVLFIVWFTYDDNGAPMWVVMPGGQWRDATTYAGDIYRTHGTPLVAPSMPAYDASALQVTRAGSFSLRFADTQHATLDVVLDGRSLSLPLVRQGF